MPPCSTVVYFISRQSLLSDIILYFAHHLHLGLPIFLLPCTLISIALLPTKCSSDHHMPIPLQPPFLDFLCDFPHFCCPSYSLISYLVNWKRCSGMLCKRRAPVKLKGNVYKTVVRPALLYGAETWATTRGQ